MADAPEFVPTLLDYANVVAWLVENGEFVGADLLPEDLEPLYFDALHRAGLGRVVAVAEDAWTWEECDARK